MSDTKTGPRPAAAEADPSLIVKGRASGPMPRGTPVCRAVGSPHEQLSPAQASGPGTAVSLGVLIERAHHAGQRVAALTRGPFRLDDDDWKVLTGGSSLVPGTAYYVSQTNAGQIVSGLVSGILIPYGVAYDTTLMILAAAPQFQAL